MHPTRGVFAKNPSKPKQTAGTGPIRLAEPAVPPARGAKPKAVQNASIARDNAESKAKLRRACAPVPEPIWHIPGWDDVDAPLPNLGGGGKASEHMDPDVAAAHAQYEADRAAAMNAAPSPHAPEPSTPPRATAPRRVKSSRPAKHNAAARMPSEGAEKRHESAVSRRDETRANTIRNKRVGSAPMMSDAPAPPPASASAFSGASASADHEFYDNHGHLKPRPPKGVHKPETHGHTTSADRVQGKKDMKQARRVLKTPASPRGPTLTPDEWHNLHARPSDAVQDSPMRSASRPGSTHPTRPHKSTEVESKKSRAESQRKSRAEKLMEGRRGAGPSIAAPPRSLREQFGGASPPPSAPSGGRPKTPKRTRTPERWNHHTDNPHTNRTRKENINKRQADLQAMFPDADASTIRRAVYADYFVEDPGTAHARFKHRQRGVRTTVPLYLQKASWHTD